MQPGLPPKGTPWNHKHPRCLYCLRSIAVKGQVCTRVGRDGEPCSPRKEQAGESEKPAAECLAS
jgi:hypothetical protein